MPISKFNLYKSEWLELVFDRRNKAYGAYDLRRHYAGNMIKAMCVAFLSVGAAALIVGVIIKPVVTNIAQPVIKTTVVQLKDFLIKHPVAQQRPAAAHAIKLHVTAPPAAAVTTTRFVPMVVTPNPVTVEPPKLTEITPTAIGPADIKGKGTAINTGPAGTQDGAGTPGTDVVEGTAGLERMPEPLGGAAAWSKFLQKNLNYPDMAVDQDKEGRVWVSFIVEKDGHLSNIVVEHGAGYGMDEEALRVLKLAPAWKPGIQNGQPVRVKYNIPINFQLQK
jgi:protein TonB